jgi:hypothetical protein
MRNCPPELKAYLDDKLPGFTGAPNALLLAAANACVGVHEDGGDNHGKLVELFQSSVGRPEGQSWCLDFLQAIISYVESKTGAISTLPATQSVLDLWNRAKHYNATARPMPGDLILWQHGTSEHGHCGMVVGADTLRYQTIEGNTSDSTEIERNGDGVFMKNRAKGGSKTFVELGFLRVF